MFNKPKDLEITRDIKQYQDAITVVSSEGKLFNEENLNRNLSRGLQLSGGYSYEKNTYDEKYINRIDCLYTLIN